MEIESFDINVKSLSYGSEEISLTFGNQEIPFWASYIGPEPISSLVESLVGLEDEIENVDFTRYFISWSDEPGSLDFEMYKNKFEDHILLKIKFDNCDTGQYHKTGNWEFEMAYSLYKQTVLNTALKALKKFGLIGFNDSWANGKETFPFCSLISLLGGQTLYHEESDSFRSNIFDELALLTNKLSIWQEQNT